MATCLWQWPHLLTQVLTLASNERVALTPSMRLLFETHHLRTATPATVSRAGILYVNPQDLGWNPWAFFLFLHLFCLENVCDTNFTSLPSVRTELSGRERIDSVELLPLTSVCRTVCIFPDGNPFLPCLSSLSLPCSFCGWCYKCGHINTNCSSRSSFSSLGNLGFASSNANSAFILWGIGITFSHSACTMLPPYQSHTREGWGYYTAFHILATLSFFLLL